MTSTEVVLVQLDLSWWWAHSARNMYRVVDKWIYLRNLVRQFGLLSTSLRKMHGQQNIKFIFISYTACHMWGVFLQFCGCFGNMCTCIYCTLCRLYCVFVLFRLCVFILICFVCTSVRTTAIEWKINCSKYYYYYYYYY
jgi:hypothetical protein